MARRVTDQALVVALLFFLHSFAPEHSSTVLAAAGFFAVSPRKDYDAWICTLIDRFDPPRKATLVMTQKRITTRMASVYWPKADESTANMALTQGTYGLVILDIPEADTHSVPTWMLAYANHVLIYGCELS